MMKVPERVLCCLPHPLDTVLLEDSISGDDGQLMAMCHDRQQAVKGIAIVERQGLDIGEVVEPKAHESQPEFAAHGEHELSGGSRCTGGKSRSLGD